MTQSTDIIQQIAAILNNELGDQVVGRASDPEYEVEYWPTGILPFDWLLGGGLPAGRSTEIYGDYSTLKSYIALCAIASVQESGGLAGLIDSEHAFDPEWATSLGVSVDDLLVAYPNTGEEAVAVTEGLVRNKFDLVVWDSVAAMLPQAEQQKSPMEQKQPARLASMMSAAMRRITAANKKTALLFINQTRVNVGITFGSPVAVPGGKALPFYASQRVKIARAGKITSDHKAWDGDKEVMVKQTDAFKIKMSLEKSKLNKPHRESWFLFDLATAEINIPSWLMGKGLEEHLIVRPNKQTWEIPDLNFSVKGKKAMEEALRDDERVSEWLISQLMGYSHGNEEADSNKD